MATKQIYIPSLRIKGTYIEELGGGEDLVFYPGTEVDVTLSKEDFDSEEDYHDVWIKVTKAVKRKLQKNESASS